MTGFIVGMFVAKDEGALIEKITFFVVISLFSLPLSPSLLVGTLYYWTVHRVDEVNLNVPSTLD